jgi:hypothetical protein
MAAVFVALAKASSNKRDGNQRIRPARSLSRLSERLGCWLMKERAVRRRQKNKENWSITADNAQLLVLRA